MLCMPDWHDASSYIIVIEIKLIFFDRTVKQYLNVSIKHYNIEDKHEIQK